MLMKNVIHEDPDSGENHFTIGPELEPDPCKRCGGESVPNICNGDGRYHWHGRVHTLGDGLEALCASCAEAAATDWDRRRAAP